ncbi:hypothetical protein [Candidatus Palauibacter sp.]|uniref:hypothetical protein n=1 Tax=Candidatus Palauibacter sp. TaxID=3101350 RepID=UPI003C6F3F33
MIALGAIGLQAQEVVDLPAEDRLLSSDLDLVYRIGSAAAGPDWEQFSAIRGLAFDAAGNLHVFDATGGPGGPARIVVVDAAGRYAGEFGGPGDGPGEFRMPRQMVVWADGRALVEDIMHMGYHVFGPGGDFERMVKGEAGRGMRPQRGPDPQTVVGASWHDSPAGMRPILRFDLSSDQVKEETLVEAWAPRAPEDDAEDAEEWGFAPELLFDVLPSGGVAFSDSSAYAIKLTDPAGTVSRVLRRPLRPMPATEAMRRAERERRLEALRNRPGTITGQPSAEDMAFMNALIAADPAAVENMRFFSQVPVVAALRTTWDGTLWVQRSTAPNADAPGPIDILAPDGRYVGTLASGLLAMPDAFGPDGLVAFIDTDEFDVPVITVRRIPVGIR